MRQISDLWTLAILGFVAYMQAADLSPNTIRLRRHYLGRLAADLPGSPWLVRFGDLVEWLARDGWQPETRKSARSTITAFYGWAVDAGHIERSPALRLPAIRIPHAVARPAPDRVLTPAMWRGTDRDRLFLMLAAYAGLRRGEIAGVHPRDVDHERQQIFVRGKGRRERWVPLHDDLYAAVRAELDMRAVGEHGTGYRYARYITPDGWLFPGRVGHVTPDVPGRVIARLLGDGWTAHTLRHRFATKAHGVERDIRAVQELLGHGRLETTMRYVQVEPESLRRAVAGVTANSDSVA